MALCSESTGIISAPEFFARDISRFPPRIRDSLFANIIRLPALAAEKVDDMPAPPTIAAITKSVFGWPAILSKEAVPNNTSTPEGAAELSFSAEASSESTAKEGWWSLQI